MKFSELKFKSYASSFGIQALVYFPNGYGASVVQSKYSYGGNSNLYELAVIERHKGAMRGFDLCFDTPITDEVVGHLTPGEVEEFLDDIAALPPNERIKK